MTTLKYFITSKAKRNLLKFFLSDVDACYYTREAARLTGEPLNAVRRELGYLEKAGLLRSYMQGNLKYYEVVKSFPLLAEWRRIILETPDAAIAPSDPAIASATKQSVQPPQSTGPQPAFAPPDPVIASAAKQSVQPPTLDSVIALLGEKCNALKDITMAIIHGEAALTETIPSDGIELLIVGDINKDLLLEMVAGIEADTGTDIRLTHLTVSGFDYRNAQGDPFVRRIWGEKKLVVKGRR